MAAPIYDQISANKTRSIALIGVFILVITAIGWAAEQLFDTGPIAVPVALAFALCTSLFSYVAGDKVALAASGAKGPIAKQQSPELWRMVENLSIAAGLPMPKVYLIEDGAINAFATGRDPGHASIAVTTGAMTRLEKTELEGVLAHELSHVGNYDIRYMLLVTILVGTVVLLADWMRHSMRWGGGKRRGNDSGAGILLVVALLVAILAPLFAQLIKFAVSRKRESLADASGALLTRYPEGLARALEKIAADTDPLDRANEATAHLYFANPFGDVRSKIVRLFSTHPPIDERVRALRGMTL